MKILTKEVLKDLSGKEFDTETTVGKMIANILASSETGGKMKLYVLATKFYQEDSVEVDEADLQLIKQAVEGSKSFTPLVTGQILVVLESLKEEVNK